MITLRKSEERGHVDHGWLKTFHTFSFSEYLDRRYMSFRSLRVINDDRVAPGEGFDTHPHKDMEIVTYVLEGALEHKDSLGTGSVIRPGDVQRMTAGTGVLHSEFNPSKKDWVHLLQIWILPERKDLTPGYEQKNFTEEERTGKLKLIASRGGQDGSVTIHQDARVYACILPPDGTAELGLTAGRHAWVHVAQGAVAMNDQEMKTGDGAAVSDEKRLNFRASERSELLVFDLA